MKEEALKLLERQPESLEDWVLYALDCDEMIRKLVAELEKDQNAIWLINNMTKAVLERHEGKENE